MSTLLIAPPDEVVAAARKGLEPLVELDSSWLGVAPERLAQACLGAPHHVYTLWRDDAIRGDIVRCAWPVGWRFILADDSDAFATVHVSERDGEYHFGGLSAGPYTQSTVEGIRRVEESGETIHELRLLTYPGIYLEALWLHDERGNRFMPVGSAYGFEALRLYPEADFAPLLARLVAESHPEGPALRPRRAPPSAGT
jgi:hypothetical protein